MTVVEFFDESQTENILSVLYEQCDQILYVGDAHVMTEEAERRIRAFAEEKKQNRPIAFVRTENRTVAEIVSVLSDLILQNGDCVFEATGGGERELIALGIVSERYDVPVIQTDIRKRQVVLLSGQTGGEPVSSLYRPAQGVSVVEALALCGGTLAGFEQNRFSADPKLRRDVEVLWRLGLQDAEFFPETGRLLSSLQASLCGLTVKVERVPDGRQRRYLERLCERGFIRDLQAENGQLRFTYRDDSVRRILVKSGNMLELATFFAVLTALPRSDVHRGVQIRWEDAAARTEKPAEPVRNEIDVLFMRGVVPFFVSCKSGNVSKEALYELETVASRFGGKYAGKILVAGCLAQGSNNPEQIKERAEGMGIALIDNACRLSVEQLGERIAAIRI